MTPDDLRTAELSDHSRTELARRGITVEAVRAVLSAPGRAEFVRPERLVLSSIERTAAGNDYVLRVFVDVDRSPPVVVTAYRSSKIAKYWGTT